MSAALNPDTDSIVAQLTEKWLELDLEIRERMELKARVTTALIEFLPPGTQIGGQGGAIKIMAPINRFDPAKARALLPADVYASICTTEPSGKLAREVLSPETYDQLQRSTGEGFVRRVAG